MFSSINSMFKDLTDGEAEEFRQYAPLTTEYQRRSLRAGDGFTYRGRAWRFREWSGLTLYQDGRVRFKVWNQKGNPTWLTVRLSD